MGYCDHIWEKLNRKKIPPKDLLATPFKRCLGLADLTLIGMGNQIGAGVFLLSGIIAHNKAGPGVVVSYLMAGGAMLLSALCYAEYGARFPNAGSSYTYTYLTLGELWSFIVGWDVMLERALSSAALARGGSAMVDAMLHSTIRNATLDTFGEMNVPGLSHYVDLLALAITLLIVVLVSLGVRVLATINMTVTSVNIATLVVIICTGFYYADWDNWTDEALGGFLPYGFQGVLAGTATLFYTFVGFESISVAGEEATDPASQIPVATLLSMLFTTVLYTGASASLTLLVPFSHIDLIAPFPEAFRELGVDWALYLVAASALCGIATSLFMDVYALSRTVYAMASDGLLFRILGWVHPVTQTPVVSTIVFGVAVSLLALLFEYETLVDLLSIGILSSFCLVAICVIVNRYRPPDHIFIPSNPDNSGVEPPQHDNDPEGLYALLGGDSVQTPILKKDFRNSQMFTSLPGESLICLSLVLLVVCSAVLGYFIRADSGLDIYSEDRNWVLAMTVLAVIGISAAMFFISAYEETNEPRHFSVPLVPYVPCFSLVINVTLLVQLPVVAWYRYMAWLAVGMLIYFAYGFRQSSENKEAPLADFSSIPMTNYSSVDDRPSVTDST